MTIAPRDWREKRKKTSPWSLKTLENSEGVKKLEMNRDVQGRKNKFKGPEERRSFSSSKNSKKAIGARKMWARMRTAKNEGAKVNRDQYM